MIRNLCVIAALICTQIATAKSKAEAQASPFSIPNTTTYEFTSTLLDRTYPVYVSVPRGYAKSADKKYPVVIVNDGPYAFPVAAGALSVPMRAGVLQQVVLVGIGFSIGDNMMVSRMRDYTPSADQNWKQFQAGQAKQYLHFLESELIPFVEEKYAVNSEKRTLVGHSAGGLFAGYAMLNRPELFESYVILSPALFWNDKLLFEQEKQYATKYNDLKARVYFAVGSTENPPSTPFDWVKDQNTFVKKLSTRNYPNLLLKEDIIQDGLHETTYPLGFVRGIIWLYAK